MFNSVLKLFMLILIAEKIFRLVKSLGVASNVSGAQEIPKGNFLLLFAD